MIRDVKGNRIGLIHHVFIGDETISVDSSDIENLVVNKFEQLESEIQAFIDLKEKEFNTFLSENNLISSMGSVDKIN